MYLYIFQYYNLNNFIVESAPATHKIPSFSIIILSKLDSSYFLSHPFISNKELVKFLKSNILIKVSFEIVIRYKSLYIFILLIESECIFKFFIIFEFVLFLKSNNFIVPSSLPVYIIGIVLLFFIQFG